MKLFDSIRMTNTNSYKALINTKSVLIYDSLLEELKNDLILIIIIKSFIIHIMFRTLIKD
jgi:hypothetical protein